MVYKYYKTLKDINVEGETVLLWIDLNSQIIKNKPIISPRFKEHSKTISLLKRKKANIVILSHQSRPGREDFTSLKEHSKLLNKYTKLKFINDIIGEKSTKAINNLKDGDAILLENIRYLKDEYKVSKKNKIVDFFKDKIDIYVNDAFSMCHRNEASLTLLPKSIKIRAIGPVLKNELIHAEEIRSYFNKSLFILGGNKVEDLILLIRKNKILPTGILALLVLKAKGYDLGKKQTNKLKKELKFIPTIKKHLKNIIIPKDLAFEINKKRKDIPTEKFPINHLALDIGKKTIDFYEKEILKEKKIFWKGTAGDCSKKEFCLGTKRLLTTINKSNSYVVVAGGHSQTAIESFKLNKDRMGYLSLSGGALVHFIAGKKLPGLEALKIK